MVGSGIFNQLFYSNFKIILIYIINLQTNSCPICRFELLTDDSHYEEMKIRRQRASEREKEIEDLHNSMFT